MDFRELQKQRAGLAHHALLHVQISEFLERANLLGSEFGDALVNGNRLGQETVADEDLREALKIINGLKRLALPDVQLPNGHQGDLVFRLVLQDLLIFRDGLRDLALIEELLCGFDVFAFAIGHSRLRHSTARACWRGCPPRRRGERQAEAVLTYASRRRKGKSTKADFRVSSQLSPLDLGTRWRKPGEPTETPA